MLELLLQTLKKIEVLQKIIVLSFLLFLQTLMHPDVLQNYLGLFELMVLFLSPKIWEKHKTELARKVQYHSKGRSHESNEFINLQIR